MPVFLEFWRAFLEDLATAMWTKNVVSKAEVLVKHECALWNPLIAILAADGVNEKNVMAVIEALTAKGAVCEVIAPRLGFIVGEGDTELPIYKSFLTAASVLYDAVYVAGGTNSIATLEAEADAVHFLNEAFKHCKPIAADASALQVLKATYFGRKLPEDESEQTAMMEGIVISDDIDTLSERFIAAIAQHRFWEREKPRKVPA